MAFNEASGRRRSNESEMASSVSHIEIYERNEGAWM